MLSDGYIFHDKIIPINCLPIWYVDESKYLQLVKGEKLNINFYPNLFFKSIEYLDSNTLTMIGNIGTLENIEFPGFPNSDGIIPTNPILLEDYPNEWVFFINYQENKPTFFTFDHITLWKLVHVFQEKPLKITLKLLEQKQIIKRNSAFMIMPFKYPSLNSIYCGIKKYLELPELKIDLKRADDFLENDIVIDTVYREIKQSEFIIAETTYCNKNVFYEIGYAAALKKEIISIQDSCITESLYFDRAHIRTLLYNIDFIEKFYTDLKFTIEAIRKKT